MLKLLIQLLVVVLWDLFFGRGCVLVMLLAKHANMLVMILKFLLVSRRLA